MFFFLFEKQRSNIYRERKAKLVWHRICPWSDQPLMVNTSCDSTKRKEKEGEKKGKEKKEEKFNGQKRQKDHMELMILDS